jgi:RimJ/RimL family protein N-acetyltransferase
VILPYNHGMLRVCEKLGFRTALNDDDRLIYAMLELTDTEK